MPKILLADDNKTNRYYLEKILSNAGYDVTALKDGKELIEEFERQKPDLIISDVDMPILDGFSAIKKLRTYKEYSHIPIIIISNTYKDMQSKLKGIELGANDYLPSPIDDDELLAKVKFMIRTKNMYDQLQSSEERYRAIFESAGTAILIIDEDTKIINANKECGQFTGYAISELVGKSWTKFVHKDDLHIMLSRHKARRKDPESVPDKYEVRLIDAKGNIRNTILSIAMIPDTKRSTVAMLDITERKQAEDALRKSDEKTKNIFNIAPIGIGVMVDRTITDVNHRFCEITGYSKDELLGGGTEKGFQNLYPAQEDYESVRNKIRTQIAQKGTGTHDVQWKRKDGKLINVILDTTPLDPNNPFLGGTFTAMDITERKKAENIIIESEDKFKSVFESVNVAKSITLPTGQVNANKALCDMLGYTNEELNNKKWIDITPADEIDYIQKLIDPLIKGDKDSVRFEKRYIHKDGSTIWSDVSATMRRDKNGKPLYFITTIIDISEKKKAEDALRASEAKYRQLIETLNDGIWCLDAEAYTSFVNPKMAKMLGYTKEEMQGKHLLSFMDDELVKEAKVKLQERHKGVIEQHEFTFKKKNGDAMHTLVNTSPLLDEQGSYSGALASITDITKLKQAEEKILVNEKRFEQVVDCSGVWVWEVDNEGLFTYVSSTVETILGYKPEEVIGKKHFYDLFAPNVKAELKKAAFEIYSTKISFRNLENSNLHKDGHIVVFETSGISMLDSHGNFIGYRGANRDITERMVAENELKNSEIRYHNLFENSSEFLFTLDLKGNFTDVNKAAEIITGYTKSELLKMNFKDYTHKRIHKELFHTFFNIYKTGTPLHDYLIVAVMKDKSEKHFEINLSLVRKGEEIIGYHGSSKDITERKIAEDMLKKSEAFLKGIIENTSDIILIVDKMGNFNYVSPSVEHVLGYRPAELIGKKIFNYIHPVDIPRAIVDYGKAIMTKQISVPNSFRVLHKDGSERILEGLGKNQFKNPAVGGFIMNVHDVTERKQAEEQLKASIEREKELADIGRYAPIAIAYGYPDGRLENCNAAFSELTGYSISELQQINWNEVLTPPSWRAIEGEQLSQLSPTQKSVQYEKEYITKDGSIVPIELSVTAKFDSAGTILHYIGFINDITDRKQNEEALKESEDRYRQIYQFSPDSIIIHDMDMNILDANNKAVEEFGYSKKEFLEMKVFELHPETQLQQSKQVLNAMKKKDMLTVETKFVRKDGSVFLAEATPCKYTLGSKPIIHVVIRDITEHKKAEEQIKNDLQEKTLLLSEVHHRVKNSLQVVTSLLQLQSNKITDKNDLELFKQSQNRIYMMAAVYEKLYLSKNFASIDFKEYLEDVLRYMQQSFIMSQRISLNIDVQNIVLGLDDATPMALIINELFTNSMKHAFPGERNGKIEIKANPLDEETYQLIYRDNGVGLSDHIDFDNTETLGLHLIKNLAEQISGKATLEQNEWTTFKIVFKGYEYGKTKHSNR
jgi:PAS domain S-box-containing protein